ncbi:MAG: hypothetical protein ACYCQI_01675 [Gammaproteobacteria bacterium]
MSQSPNYAYPYTPHCPDHRVQFVIGNNFTQHPELEEVVLKVQMLAMIKGYHPIYMDINRHPLLGPHPTVHNYLDWMSCPNVKGFYNESHGNPDGIALKDDDLIYSLIDKNLVNQLKEKVVLFDSCDTFQNPLLSSMTDKSKGNSQKYIAGIVPLRFGPSEKTAACFWFEAIYRQAQLNQQLIVTCAKQSGLDPYDFRIKGNDSDHMRPATT